MSIPYNPHRDQPVNVEVSLSEHATDRLVVSVRITDEGVTVTGFHDGRHAGVVTLPYRELLPQMFE